MSQNPEWLNTFCYSAENDEFWFPYMIKSVKVKHLGKESDLFLVSGIKFESPAHKGDFKCVSKTTFDKQYKDYVALDKRDFFSQQMKKEAFVVPANVTKEMLETLVDEYDWPEQFLYNKPIPVKLVALHNYNGYKVYEAYHDKKVRMCYPASWIQF